FSDQQPDTYFDSYHGKAGKIGGVETANCASCHGVHNIYDDEDDRSMINKANLEHTCQQCHIDAGPNFIMGKIHTSSRHPTDPIASFVRTLYFWFIGLTIAFMITHNVLIFVRHLWEKIQHESTRPRVRRFSISQMVQHHLVAIGFIVLGMTGFALAYPESTYTHLLEYFGMTEAPRQIIHRSAGVLLTVVFSVHLLGLVVTRGGRRELRYILPNWQDFKDLVANLSFAFGQRKSPPKVGRYAYWEKMEYWALIWGMILMVLTGFTLWYPTWVTHFFPRLIVDIAGIIHFYEAVLATLAILYWHLFFVVYHPTEYPLALSMFNGQVTVEELKKHRPLEYEDMVRDGKIPPEAMVPPEKSEDPGSGQNQDTV
ncbi:MAG: cytochrome b/b6 domain-containing protein, partial [Candidatus Omnitrophica bacterium]|nr:cytochrome b/b6 domain-containing protein [Candidatus Omnitrophota bacterium]